jgi:cobalt-zinc-cadmium efflux system protein
MHTHQETRDIRTAFFVNLGFAALEVVGGVWTNSMAIVSDALHDFVDTLSLGLSWYLGGYSQRKEDARYSYGYRRFSMLAALINVVVLLAGTLLILSEAIPRLWQPEPTNARGMALLAVVGIVANGLAALRVRGGKSLNAQVVTWHLFEDVLGWLAVLVVGIILLFWDVRILDPLLSIAIALYVLYNVVVQLRKTLALFLQAVPGGVDIDEIERKLLEADKVQGVHHTHVWSLDGEHHVLTTHVVVDEDTTRDEVCQIKAYLWTLVEDLDVEHVTVDVEYVGESCMLSPS